MSLDRVVRSRFVEWALARPLFWLLRRGVPERLAVALVVGAWTFAACLAAQAGLWAARHLA